MHHSNMVGRRLEEKYRVFGRRQGRDTVYYANNHKYTVNSSGIVVQSEPYGGFPYYIGYQMLGRSVTGPRKNLIAHQIGNRLVCFLFEYLYELGDAGARIVYTRVPCEETDKFMSGLLQTFPFVIIDAQVYENNVSSIRAPNGGRRVMLPRPGVVVSVGGYLILAGNSVTSVLHAVYNGPDGLQLTEAGRFPGLVLAQLGHDSQVALSDGSELFLVNLEHCTIDHCGSRSNCASRIIPWPADCPKRLHDVALQHYHIDDELFNVLLLKGGAANLLFFDHPELHRDGGATLVTLLQSPQNIDFIANHCLSRLFMSVSSVFCLLQPHHQVYLLRTFAIHPEVVSTRQFIKYILGLYFNEQYQHVVNQLAETAITNQMMEVQIQLILQIANRGLATAQLAVVTAQLIGSLARHRNTRGRVALLLLQAKHLSAFKLFVAACGPGRLYQLESEHVDLVQLLVEHYGELDEFNKQEARTMIAELVITARTGISSGETALMRACRVGNYALIPLLCTDDTIQRTDAAGQTALHILVQNLHAGSEVELAELDGLNKLVERLKCITDASGRLASDVLISRLNLGELRTTVLGGRLGRLVTHIIYEEMRALPLFRVLLCHQLLAVLDPRSVIGRINNDPALRRYPFIVNRNGPEHIVSLILQSCAPELVAALCRLHHHIRASYVPNEYYAYTLAIWVPIVETLRIFPHFLPRASTSAKIYSICRIDHEGIRAVVNRLAKSYNSVTGCSLLQQYSSEILRVAGPDKYLIAKIRGKRDYFGRGNYRAPHLEAGEHLSKTDVFGRDILHLNILYCRAHQEYNDSF